ncbi:hypothetical protein C8R47DRAFT_1206997 [Mycena vitilis]|nr:hypothetical protein C8R47DRAFT_1206997 [Mycena vitilis]
MTLFRLTLKQLFTMSHTIDASAFEEGWNFALCAMNGLCVGALCYGILLVLLGVAASLLGNWTGSARKILAAAALAMGMFATAQAGLQMRGIVFQLRFVRAGIEGEKRPLTGNLNFASVALFVTNNLGVDSLFTYRCLVVWGHDIRVITLPILLLLTTAALGYLDVYGHISVHNMGVVMALLTHILLVGLTGRIWWVRRDARVLELEAAHARRYNAVIAIILESGAMYLIGNTTWLIFSSISSQDSPSTLSSPDVLLVRLSIPQIMNIIPILTIVRLGLRRDSADSSFRYKI